MSGLLLSGDFLLNSGRRSSWKLECDALSDADIATAAYLIAALVGPFGEVEGVPRGGLRLARALRLYGMCECGVTRKGHDAKRPVKTCGGCDLFRPVAPLLCADDVYTTGGSMNRHLAGREAKGAVLFARGMTPPSLVVLFRMPEGLPC